LFSATAFCPARLARASIMAWKALSCRHKHTCAGCMPPYVHYSSECSLPDKPEHMHPESGLPKGCWKGPCRCNQERWTESKRLAPGMPCRRTLHCSTYMFMFSPSTLTHLDRFMRGTTTPQVHHLPPAPRPPPPAPAPSPPSLSPASPGSQSSSSSAPRPQPAAGPGQPCITGSEQQVPGEPSTVKSNRIQCMDCIACMHVSFRWRTTNLDTTHHSHNPSPPQAPLCRCRSWLCPDLVLKPVPYPRLLA
jgi:hypothetical protein